MSRLDLLARLDTAVRTHKKLKEVSQRVDDSSSAVQSELMRVGQALSGLDKTVKSIPKAAPVDLSVINSNMDKMASTYVALVSKVQQPVIVEKKTETRIEVEKQKVRGDFRYTSATIDAGETLNVKGTILCLRAFATAKDSQLKINGGDKIPVRKDSGFDLNPVNKLVNAVLFCAAGELDIFIELE